MDQAFLILRLVFGLTMAAHGSQKLFGWFGGYGLTGTGGFLEGLGFRPGKAFAFAAGASEFLGGLLIAIGLLGPVGPALVLATMVVAAVTVHIHNGLLATSNGIELPLLYAAAAVAIAISGSSYFTADALLGIAFSPLINWGVLFAGLAGGLANLALRHAPAAKEA
ncbi:MAG: putative oxidoreductase [Thermoanaerobaculia bacterium]|jgi:putative oxidoreductase|nr:putative oxidoreductase [Thermoanaerobaculia bacterium]